jgi:hypothetical protein
MTTRDDYAFEERAAILEYDAGFDRETAEAKAILMELKRRKRERNAAGSTGVAGESFPIGEETPT